MFAFLRGLLGTGRSVESRQVVRRSLRLEALEGRYTPSTIQPVQVANVNMIAVTRQPLPPVYNPFVVSGNTLSVYGTAGNDRFDFTAGTTTNKATLNGASFTINPAQIRFVYFYGQGGSDISSFTDYIGPATANLYPHSANMSGANYYVNASFTTTNYAFGTAGGTANIYDSTGNDTFYSGGRSAGMYDSNFTYLNSATGFSINNGYSSAGGTDKAQFFDTAGNDTYYSNQGYAGMFDSADTYVNYAKGFASTHGYSTAGGTDTAYLFNDTASAVFIGNGSDATMIGVHLYNTATGFRDVEAYASAAFVGYYQFDGAVNYTVNFHGIWDQE